MTQDPTASKETPAKRAKSAPRKKPVARKTATRAKTPTKKVVAAKPPAKPVAATPAAPAPKPKKPKKQKIVRDSFTMPESDYAHIAALKKRCLKSGVSAKKSELLRAALLNLSALGDPALLKLLAKLPPVIKGRPKKD